MRACHISPYICFIFLSIKRLLLIKKAFFRSHALLPSFGLCENLVKSTQVLTPVVCRAAKREEPSRLQWRQGRISLEELHPEA